MSINKIRALFSREIPLTQGKVAIVDAADFEWLNQWKWYAHYDPSTDGFYAVRNIELPKGEKRNRKSVKMHRVIMGEPEGFKIDHADGDGLHNRRINLRIATNQQNAFNRKKRSDNRSGHTGVSWHNSSGKWQAQINRNGKRKCLGVFPLREDAIECYRKAAVETFGEFARIA